MPKTLREWLIAYKDKTGSDFKPRPSEVFLFDAEKGICTYEIELSENVLVVGGVCGDGQYWNDILQKIARQEKCKQIIFYTSRPPKVWERKYGFKLHSYLMVKEVD